MTLKTLFFCPADRKEPCGGSVGVLGFVWPAGKKPEADSRATCVQHKRMTRDESDDSRKS